MGKSEFDKHCIDSFEKLCNTVNDSNIETLSKDLALWLVSYNHVITLFRKNHPEETRGKKNFEIAKGSFEWIDDGKTNIKKFVFKADDTGDEKHIHLPQRDVVGKSDSIDSKKNVHIPSRNVIRKIIELTAEDCDGTVWGSDMPLGTMDNLIDKAIKILKNNSQKHSK